MFAVKEEEVLVMYQDDAWRKTSVECRTHHVLDDLSFAYVEEKGRSFQALTLDEKKFKMANDTAVDQMSYNSF